MVERTCRFSLLTLLTFVLWTHSSHVFAIRTMDDMAQLQSRVYQEPMEVAQEIENFLKTFPAKDNLDLWTSALNMHLILFQGDFDAPESEVLQENWINETLDLQSKAPDSVIKLEFYSQVLFRKVRKMGTELNLEATSHEFEGLAQKAKAWGHHLTLAAIDSEYMFFLSSRHESVKALEVAQLALSEIAADLDKDKGYQKAEIQSNIAVFYLNEGKLDEALNLWLDIHKAICREERNLYFCNPILTNIAGVYIQRNSSKDTALALPYLEQAFKDAQAIHDVSTLAQAHYKRATIFFRQESWSRALSDYESARDLYRKLDSPSWMIKILVGMARVQNQMGRYEAARRTLAEAQTLVTPESRELHPDLDDAIIQNLKGLGHFEEALALLSQRFKVLQNDYKTKTTKVYNESMAHIGLQVEQERNKVLERDKEIVQLKLNNSEKFQKILLLGIGLCLLIAIAGIWVIYQNRLIRRFKVELQRVLDTIDEAIFTVDSHLTIKGPISKFLKKIRPDQIIEVEDDFIQAVLRGSLLTDDQIEVIKECLQAMLNEDSLAWDLNMAHLPLEIAYAFQGEVYVLSVNWQPLRNVHDKLEGIMISMRDITERRNIERAIHQERHDRQLASECLLELARADLNRVRLLLEQISALLLDTEASADTITFRRELHTVKGVARSLGLRVLSQGVHRLEDSKLLVLEDRNQLIDICRIYQEILIPIERSGGTFEIKPIVELSGLWSHIVPGVLQRLEQEKLPYAGAAVIDQVGIWPPELLMELEKCLIHAVNNSIDHGFVKAQRRNQSIADPHFEIEALIDNDRYRVMFRDNGQGIDFEQLAELAKRLDFPWKRPEELLELIFTDGASTSGELSETSGRGIGMAAVRTICRNLGGDAQITARKHRSGAELTLSFGLEQIHTMAV